MYVISSVEKVPQGIVLDHGVITRMHKVHVTDCRTGTRTIMFPHTGSVLE